MKEEGRIYEVGYHILPTVSEEMVPKEVESLKAILAKHNATVIGEDAPEEIDLAYGIRKSIGGKYQIFTKAHFGAIKFEGAPEDIVAIERAFATHEKVLRSLVVKTTRESTRADMEKLFPKEETPESKEKAEDAEKEAGAKEAVAKKAKKAADEEIDKSIESLIK